MLRYALRRLLWAIPTLFGASILVFLLATLLPEPPSLASAEASAIATRDFTAYDRIEEERRARFLDLPRFFNGEPRDVKARAEECVTHLAEGSPRAPLAAHVLARLGGAALPYVLPELDNLAADARGRVAVALAPIATRMGLGASDDLTNPERAAHFWTHFWEDRSLDFTEPSMQRALRRLLQYGSDGRERDILLTDTFALGPVIVAMESTIDRVALERLTRLATHASGRGSVATIDLTSRARNRIVADWKEWWYVNGADYLALDGAQRVVATLGATRYGKWATRVASGQLGVSARDGKPIAPKLLARVGVTLLVTGSAMLASFALAVPIGVFAALRRGRPIDTAIAVSVFALYSMPTFWSAMLLARLFGDTGALVGTARIGVGETRLGLAILTLTLASLATLSRQQRSAMLEVVGQDYVRTARAKGVPELRVVIVHALRNALAPTVTLASLQIPSLLGGAFVVEEVFGLPGLGYETLRAVETHDAPWLMATILLTAAVTTLALVLSDIFHALIVPRVRDVYVHRQGALA